MYLKVIALQFMTYHDFYFYFLPFFLSCLYPHYYRKGSKWYYDFFPISSLIFVNISTPPINLLLIHVDTLIFNRESLYASSIRGMVSANLVQVASLTTLWEFSHTITPHHLRPMSRSAVCWGHHPDLLH